MKVVITRREELILTDAEVEQIFNAHLSRLEADRWTENGRLREEHCTSHRFDADCDDQSDYSLVEAIKNLRFEIMKKKEREAPKS